MWIYVKDMIAESALPLDFTYSVSNNRISSTDSGFLSDDSTDSDASPNGVKLTLHFVGAVRKTGEGYALELSAAGKLRAVCDFCLKPVTVDVAFDVNERFIRGDTLKYGGAIKHDTPRDVPRASPLAKGGTVYAEEEDVFVFNGQGFDIAQAIDVNARLNLPEYVRCRDDCKGLCPMCGHDLNEGACACERSGDPRFDVLRNAFYNE
ncbi:MAG: DUF177 domain-containing protein [Clostridiales bacterium]|jgi:uncharacterized protein|nr:DUF177 domain-containing protein [Clostridiales bacterium]